MPLLEQEKVLHLKSTDLWISMGDQNSISFLQKFMNHRKLFSTIWEIQDPNGNEVRGFSNLSTHGVRYFESLFKELE
jgi:hypothetical protein